MATYRRSARRARYSAQRGHEGQGGIAGRVMLGLLAVAAVLYFVTASVAGNWLSENVINPVMEAFNPAPAAPAPLITPPPGALDITSPGAAGPVSAPLPAPAEPDGEPVSAAANAAVGTDFKLEGASFYAVQMGAFKSEDNARAEADAVRARGGAGYVFFDGELYRVLASAYASEAEARDVRESLKADMIESGVFPIDIAEVDLRVTAGANVVSAMTGAVDALKSAREEMTALSIALDREEKTQAEAAEEAAVIRGRMQAALDELRAEAGSDNAVISSLEGAMEKMLGDLEQLSSEADGSKLDFSSMMKYTQIGIIADTVEFITEITS